MEPSDLPPTALQVIKFVFQKLGIPLAEDKVFGPTTCLDFLGITLDTLLMEARLHHHVYLNQAFREDLTMRGLFLRSWNGRSYFLEEDLTQAPDIDFYNDASGTSGYGAYYHTKWFMGDWEPCQLLLAALLWGTHWSCERILVLCDNEDAVGVINSGTSKCPVKANLLRRLILCSMQCNFLVRAKHLPGKNNPIADALSRNQVQCFRRLAPNASPLPTPIPEELLTKLRP